MLRKFTLPGDCFVASLPRKDKSCFLLRGKWHEVPIGDLSLYFAIAQYDVFFWRKFSKREISAPFFMRSVAKYSKMWYNLIKI